MAMPNEAARLEQAEADLGAHATATDEIIDPYILRIAKAVNHEWHDVQDDPACR